MNANEWEMGNGECLTANPAAMRLGVFPFTICYLPFTTILAYVGNPIS